MRRKLIVLTLVLGLTLFANLRPGCCVEGADGYYSPRALRLARLTASRAAEEIVPGGGALPRLRVSWRLSLRQPEDAVPALSRAFLSRIPGVTVRSEVRVNGVALGTVAFPQLGAQGMGEICKTLSVETLKMLNNALEKKKSDALPCGYQTKAEQTHFPDETNSSFVF